MWKAQPHEKLRKAHSRLQEQGLFTEWKGRQGAQSITGMVGPGGRGEGRRRLGQIRLEGFGRGLDCFLEAVGSH